MSLVIMAVSWSVHGVKCNCKWIKTNSVCFNLIIIKNNLRIGTWPVFDRSSPSALFLTELWPCLLVAIETT